MANLRHPTWRLESSPSSSRVADAGVADVSLGGPAPSAERGEAGSGYCACSRQRPRLASRPAGSAAPRFEPLLGRGYREAWNADQGFGACPGPLPAASASTPWCGARGLGIASSELVSHFCPLLTNPGQRFNYSWSQFTNLSIG